MADNGQANRFNLNQYCRSILENSPVGIAMSRQGRSIYANQVYLRMFGYDDISEIYGTPLLDQIAPLCREEVRERIKSRVSGRPALKAYETIGMRKDGSLFPFFVQSECIELFDGPALIAFFTDITERKRAEEALRQSEEKYRMLVENAGDAIYTVDCQGRFLMMNHAAARYLNGMPEEFIGRSVWEFFPRELVDQKMDCVRRVISSGTGKTVERAISIQGTERWFSLNLQPVAEIKESASGALVIARDITERKHMERDLQRLDRLNLVGDIAVSIGHEIRNPMTTVRGFLQLMREKTPDSGDHECINLMIEELDRANAIITEFLSLARSKAVTLQVHNLNSLLHDLLPLLLAEAALHGKKVVLQLSDVADLVMDEKEIRQMIIHLVRNGLEAAPPNGTVSIKTFSEGEEVVLAVQDQGQGIEPGLQDRIGMPFFTTKDNAVGLGLAVSYSIAARHDSVITFDTSPVGTTFYVRFRRSGSTLAA